MYAAMTHRRVFLHAIGILMICTLLLSLPLPDVSQAETPALTHTFYIPLVRATDLSGKIAMNLIDTSSTHTLNKLEVLDAASLTIAELGQGDSPSWSPDGTKIAFLAYREISLEAKLYVINPDGSGETKLSNTPAGAEEPRWSPDGTKILFQIYNQPSTYWAIINADGTASSPIVFTSAETSPAPGDLGGLVIAGQATTNGNHAVMEGGLDPAFSAFGGTNDDHNSGVLRYVRIEYAGKAVNPGDEVNGLSLYGVGRGTTIDYVQIVRGLDDAFEFFGGTVNCKHLIAYNCADDDFDMDDGYRGRIQFAISIKDKAFTDNKGTSGDISNNFEVDNVNPANGFLLSRTPTTFPTLSNFTAIGPNNAPGANGTSSDFGYGMRWRRGCKFIPANSIVMGSSKAGLDVEHDSTGSYYSKGTSRFYNSFLNAVQNTYQVASTGTFLDLATLQARTETENISQVLTVAGIGLTDPFNNASPNLKPATGSPALSVTLGRVMNLHRQPRERHQQEHSEKADSCLLQD